MKQTEAMTALAQIGVVAAAKAQKRTLKTVMRFADESRAPVYAGACLDL